MTIVVPAEASPEPAAAGKTRLQLCQDLRGEAGISGTGPTTTLSQVGEYKRVVDWIDKAYEWVQNLRPTWDFLKNDFAFSTLANVADYSKTAVSLTELGSWKTDSIRCYAESLGIADEQDLDYVPWEQFRFEYGRGTQGTLTGRPRIVTVRPDISLMFWPIPVDVYVVTGEYFKRAQTMSTDTSEPLIPNQFREVIVWKALMYYGAFAGADEKYTHGQNEYRAVLNKLLKHQLPRIEYGAPLC